MLVKLKSYTLSDYYSVGARENLPCFSAVTELKGQINRGNSAFNTKKIRNKMSRFYVIIAAMLLVIISCVVAFSTSAYGSSQIQYHNVIVEEGDRLWNIAREYCSKDMDIRYFINEIIRVNNIKGDYIYPGMVLKIPVK